MVGLCHNPKKLFSCQVSPKLLGNLANLISKLLIVVYLNLIIENHKKIKISLIFILFYLKKKKNSRSSQTQVWVPAPRMGLA